MKNLLLTLLFVASSFAQPYRNLTVDIPFKPDTTDSLIITTNEPYSFSYDKYLNPKQVAWRVVHDDYYYVIAPNQGNFQQGRFQPNPLLNDTLPEIKHKDYEKPIYERKYLIPNKERKKSKKKL